MQIYLVVLGVLGILTQESYHGASPEHLQSLIQRKDQAIPGQKIAREFRVGSMYQTSVLPDVALLLLYLLKIP